MLKVKTSSKRKGFTLLEIFIVLAIIGILVTLAIVYSRGSSIKARDARRVTDIKKIQTALESFYYNQGRYPAVEEFVSPLSFSGIIYLQKIPVAPNPADGDCSDEENVYVYEEAGLNNGDYILSFCLGSSSGGFSSGVNIATTDNISN